VQEQSFAAAQSGKELQDLQLKWRGQLQQARASALLLQLAESLLENPVISVSLTEKQLRVSNRTARQYVHKLLKLGILKQFGEAKYARLYFAPAIFEIFP
jgi:Fic family protein